ncbi:MAG: MFS transporter [Deltaproteobacteria bacterium]|nr:MFS transporter [Deltaproteobacteria bacterium]
MKDGRSGRIFYGWIVVWISFLTLFLVYGARFSYGLFVRPFIDEFGWSRAQISLAASLNFLLFGFIQILAGGALGRVGPRRMVAWSLGVLGIAHLLVPLSHGLWQLYLIYGLLAAVGLSGASTVTLGVVVARWFQARRGLALGIINAGVSAGQMVLIPAVTAVILTLGWRAGWWILGGLLLLAVPLVATMLRDDPAELGLQPLGAVGPGKGAGRPGLREMWRGACIFSRSGPFWLLSGGYFVCGFSATMMSTHLPIFITDRGFSLLTAANVMALIGGMNVVGSMTIGAFSDRAGRHVPLAGIYFMRGLSLLFLLVVHETALPLYLFAVVFGYSYFATVPLVTALVSQNFGDHNLGLGFGLISFWHMIGSAVGSYLAGAIFDLAGTYVPIFMTSAVLLMGATALSLRVPEEAPAPLPAVPAAA